MAANAADLAGVDSAAASIVSIDSNATAETLTAETMQLDKSQPPTPDGSGRPANFQIIAPGLYRSSYPLYAHFEQLVDLGLKTIVTLVPGALPAEYQHFIAGQGIVHHQIPILANKDPKVYTPDETVDKVLHVMLDPSNYPLLVHCNKGRHRTGTIVASFRKVTGWTLDTCIDEYERYARPKDRDLDRVFIERYDASALKPLAFERGYVGGVWRQPPRASTKSSVYTTNTVETAYTSDESDFPLNDYQERLKRASDGLLDPTKIPADL